MPIVVCANAQNKAPQLCYCTFSLSLTFSFRMEMQNIKEQNAKREHLKICLKLQLVTLETHSNGKNNKSFSGFFHFLHIGN
jgi:hypothetical protein